MNIRCVSSNVHPGNGFTFWQKLWELELMPKVQFFVWKLGNSILSTKVASSKKGMEVGLNCDICCDYDEDLIHLFRDCIWSRGFWNALNLPFVNFDAFPDLVTWSKDLFSTLQEFEIKRFLYALWWIWIHRKSNLFDKIC
ncbi:hypothetical protein ACFE04_029994 [Oxalis oulophora]